MITALAAAPARLGGGGALDLSLTRIVSALVLCVLLAAVVALILKRGGGRIDWTLLKSLRSVRPTQRIKVIESRRISPHADVCLLRCDDEDFLILSSQGTQQVILQRPAREEMP